MPIVVVTTCISKKCKASCWKNQASGMDFVPQKFSSLRHHVVVRAHTGASHFMQLATRAALVAPRRSVPRGACPRSKFVIPLGLTVL
jgi:hypothetical protein